ncbi:MAG: sulfotransferase [Candidatus Marinimicrobia bacterium]|nr:sulfotransferase [Candidatus Neomarinimicrobiota bacterium]
MSQLDPKAPVCITGMHRSGTSLIARMLNLCGLQLGPADQILPPGEGNPQGFWQNREMDRITEQLLVRLADGWDFLLPPFPDGWESSPDSAPDREQARRQIAVLARQQPWGWKDPRASLTLPFWRALLPDLRVVICLRHPAEVNASLKKQVGSSDSFNFNLWLRYYQRLLATTTESERLFTHFDMYFIDPDLEIRRLLDWLGWSATDEDIRRAVKAVVAESREQHQGPAGRAEPEIPAPVAKLYRELCRQCGPRLAQALDEGELPGIAIPPETVAPLPAADDTKPEQRKQAEQKFGRAQQLIEQGELKAAGAELEAALELNPHYFAARHDLGVLGIDAGRLEQARAQLEIAAHLEPANSAAAGTLAALYQQLGRHEDAIKTYLRLVAHRPDDKEALLWLAEAAAQVGRPERARDYAQRLLSLEPQHTAARSLLDTLK